MGSLVASMRSGACHHTEALEQIRAGSMQVGFGANSEILGEHTGCKMRLRSVSGEATTAKSQVTRPPPQ